MEVTYGHICYHWKLMIKDESFLPGPSSNCFLSSSTSVPRFRNLPFSITPLFLQPSYATMPSPTWLWNSSHICLLFPNMSLPRCRPHPHMFAPLHQLPSLPHHLTISPLLCLHTIYNSWSSWNTQEDTIVPHHLENKAKLYILISHTFIIPPPASNQLSSSIPSPIINSLF